MGELWQKQFQENQEGSWTGISQTGNHLWCPGMSTSCSPRNVGSMEAGLQRYLHWNSFPMKDGPGAVKRGYCLCVLVFPSQTGDLHFLGEGLRLRVIEIGTVFLMNSGLDGKIKFSVVKTLCSHHNLLKQSSFPWCRKVLFSYCI